MYRVIGGGEWGGVGGRSCTRGLAVGIRVLEYEYRCRIVIFWKCHKVNLEHV